MSKTFSITKKQIEERSIPQSLNRGKRYFRNGRVNDCVRRGTTLEASVQGSQYSPYHVEVECSESGEIRNTWCTCPYDWGGDCKHIIAVLLMWKEVPDRFREKKTVEGALEDRSREELKTLVELMLEREPSLRSLLDQDLPGSTGESVKLQDPDTYRTEVQDILEAYGGHGHEHEIANLLQTLIERAERHLRSKEYGHTYGICRAVADEVLDLYEMTHDQGDLGLIVDRAEELLEECLEAVKEYPEPRRHVIDALFSIIEWDIDFGGIGFGQESWETILEHSTEEDRTRLIERIETQIAPEESDPSTWSRNALGRMLFDLYEQDDRAEEFLDVAGELGLYELLAYRLLELDRTDEAMNIADEHLTSAYRVVQFADRLLEKGKHTEAHTMVERCADRNDDDRLRVWLSEFEEQHGDPETAFKIERQRFRKKPKLKNYHRLCELAEQLENRDAVEEELKEELEKKERWKVLAQIYLEEEKWDRAWEYAKHVQEYTGRHSTGIREQVVRESEKARPERAIEYYQQKARELIDQRGRGNYARAAEYLQQVQEIYEREENESEWIQCIREFRTYADNLPACQDEMDKAGLANPQL